MKAATQCVSTFWLLSIRSTMRGERAASAGGQLAFDPIRETNDALSVSSETIFAANPSRAEACVTNNSATVTIYIARGATATANSDAVGPGGSWCIEVVQNAIYTGVISGLAASSTPDIGGQECSK